MGKPNPTCFMGDTHLATARGATTVSTVKAGDEVIVLRDGREVLEPVKWVGHTYMDLAGHPRVEEAAPVRIRKGALAENQPSRDLLLSPEHCLIIDGSCVSAKLLVNGGSIVSERHQAPFTYYHIELERHGILLAEATPAESYLDTGNRSLFDNSDEPRMLHPEFRHNADRWLTDACAPLLRDPNAIAELWARFATRSGQIGYPIPAVPTVDDADIHIVADGDVIRPVSDSNSRYVFAVPAGVQSVSLMSRFCIPADRMIAAQRDGRRLGVSVAWIAIRSGNEEIHLPADHPDLQDGWNDVEHSGNTIWRWTTGAAEIPWENVHGSAVLTVRCSPAADYPLYSETLPLVA